MWLASSDGRIEICVTKDIYSRGVTVHDISEQMGKYSDNDIYADISGYGDVPEYNEFRNREELLEFFLFVHEEGWEED